MIEGGWSYVLAAYGITWMGLALYAASLWMRGRHPEIGPSAQMPEENP